MTRRRKGGSAEIDPFSANSPSDIMELDAAVEGELRRAAARAKRRVRQEQQITGNRRSAKARQSMEAKEQRAFVKWARNRGLTLWHTPNQLSARSAKQGRQNYLLGVTAGVADIVVIDVLPANPAARGLALEFKAPGGKSTPEQLEWASTMRRHGWLVFEADNAKAQAICIDLGL